MIEKNSSTVTGEEEDRGEGGWEDGLEVGEGEERGGQ